MKLGKLAFVQLTDIDFGDRRREDYGDIDELARGIKTQGLIHPIAVQSDDGNAPFLLAAGGRRFMAVASLGESEIACRIYDHPLNSLELKSIELLENLDRKEMNHSEIACLQRDIHDLQIEIHGEKIRPERDASGHSMRDTAKLLGRSIGTVSENIKLANAMDEIPELKLDECKNRSDAMKRLEKFETGLIHTEMAKRAEAELGAGDKKLLDYYIIGDFFDKVKEIPDGTFNLVEIDPPYAIDLQHIKKAETSYKSNYGSSYNEINKNVYKEFMYKTLEECYRVMTQDAWLILWFGPEPWFEDMYNLLIDARFEVKRLPGIWTKPGGQTMQPKYNLANAYEMFFYARKGRANMNKQGRSNVFNFSPVTPSEKIHPTERPLDLIEEILSTFSWEGSRVLVPFAGSGKTLKAAKNLNMYPIGFDLSKEYKEGFAAQLLT